MKKLPWIYVACPYTHHHRYVEIDRWSRVSGICAQIFATKEFYPYSPITHSHSLVTEGAKHFNIDLSGTFDLWEDYDHAFMSKCDELWVVTLDGWDISRGVCAEMKMAHTLEIPICFVPDQTFNTAYKSLPYDKLDLRWQK